MLVGKWTGVIRGEKPGTAGYRLYLRFSIVQ